MTPFCLPLLLLLLLNGLQVQSVKRPTLKPTGIHSFTICIVA